MARKTYVNRSGFRIALPDMDPIEPGEEFQLDLASVTSAVRKMHDGFMFREKGEGGEAAVANGGKEKARR